MKSLKITVCALALLAAGTFALSLPHHADAADAFNAAQKTEIETVIRDYLMKNPQVLVEALQEYQNRQGELQAEAAKGKIKEYESFLHDPSAPSTGNPKGDVTVVEFFDYNCGYCKHAIDDVQKLIDGDKNVRIVFRDYPILSEASNTASRYALAAGKQGKYWEFHQKLMKFAGEKNDTTYEGLAKDLGLDYAKLKQDAESKEIREMLEKNIEVARAMSIQGTPAFVIGDTLVPGYVDADAMKDLVTKAREGKR